MTESTESRTRLATDLLYAVVVALLLRIGFLAAMRRAIDMADAIHYINMAKQFAAGDFFGFDENLPVLYSIFGAISHLFIHDWEHAFWVVSLIASTLLVIPVYLLAHELFGLRTARIATTLACAWPWLIDYGSRIAPEALAVTLFFTSIYLLNRAMEVGKLALIFAPLSFFLLHMTRPEGTFLMLAAPLAACILCYGRTRTHWKRLATFTIACAALLAAYAIVMRLAIGTATVSYRAPMSGDLLDYFRRGFVDLGRTAISLFANVLPVMLGPILLLFIGVGLFRPTERPRNARLELFILFFCGAQWALTMANFSPTPRYIMSVVIALSIWSARGIDLVMVQASAARYARWLTPLPLAAVLSTMFVGIAYGFAGEALGRMPSTPREYKIAGHWMRDNLEPGYVISRKPQVGFYADMPSIGPDSNHDIEGVVEFAKHIGARYLIVDERHSVAIIPALRPLLDPTNAPPTSLRLIDAELSPYPGAKVVIYEFIPPGIEYIAPKDVAAATSHMGPDQRRRNEDIPDGS